MGSDSSKSSRNTAQQQENRAETYQYGPPTTQNRANVAATIPNPGPRASNPQVKPNCPPVPARTLDLPPSYSSVAPNTVGQVRPPASLPKTNRHQSQAPAHAVPSASNVIRQYCSYCGKIVDHKIDDCPKLAEQMEYRQLLWCSVCDTYGHDAYECPVDTLGISKPKVLRSAPPIIPARPVQYAVPAPAVTKVNQPPTPLPRQISKDPPISAAAAPGKQIDLSNDMPKILEQMKNNKLPSYQNLKQQLCKNKPIKDVRSSMVNNEYLSDVKFIINGSPFYAHKMALITASSLFYDHFQTQGKTELNVEFIDIETFEQLIKYCYSEQLQVTEENVLELLKGANQLQIRQVTNVCHGFISNLMSPDSIFVIFEKAMEINYEIFQKKCLDFIKNNEEKCFASNGFYAISLPSLMKVLQACNYSREKENEIVEKWTNGGIGLGDEAAAKTPEIKPVKTIPPKADHATPKVQKKKQQPPQQQKIPPCPVPYNHGQQFIPDLMSLPIPNPNSGLPLPSPFSYEPAYLPTFQLNPQRPFAKPSQFPPPQHNFGKIPPNPLSAPGPKNNKPRSKSRPRAANLIVVDDGDDDLGADRANFSKIEVLGVRHRHATEFSRLDLFCTRSMLIHEIFFSENLAAKSKAIRVTITTLEQGQTRDVHKRTVSINSGMKMNFVKFSREPLKLYVGQKFSIKLNFEANVELINVNADSLLLNPMVELNKDSKKKYFNCVSSLTVSDMLSA